MSWPSRKPKDSSRWRCPGRADRAPGSVRGRHRTQSGSRPSARDLLLEWAWDVNAHLDTTRIAAGSRERVAWRCLLDSAHVWETKVADRTYRASFWPYPMGNRVHPAESLAAYFPWLALEWHPSRNDLRPDQVTRASAREVVWRCERGPEWSTAVYQRTLSRTGCPDCYKLEAAARTRAGRQRARQTRDQAALTALPEVIALHEPAVDSEAV